MNPRCCEKLLSAVRMKIVGILVETRQKRFPFSECELSSNSACRASISFEIVAGERETNFNKVELPDKEKLPDDHIRPSIVSQKTRDYSIPL